MLMETLYHKTKELKINPIFRDLIPPLADDERTLLEESIVSTGCHTAIEIWDGVIVDGHNRYEICTINNIQFQTRELFFKDDEEAKIYIINNQLGRRNLTPAVRGDLAWQKAGMIEERARANQLRKPESVSAERQKQTEPIHTAKELAKQTNIPERTLAKIKRIRDSGDEKVRDKMLRGDISISAADNEISNRNAPPKVCSVCGLSEPEVKFSTSGARCNGCRRQRELDLANYVPPELRLSEPPEETLDHDNREHCQIRLTATINDFLIDTQEFLKTKDVFNGLNRSSELYGTIVKAIGRLDKFKELINGGNSL